MSDQSNSSPAPPQRRMSISAIFAPLSNSISGNASSPPSAGVPATPDTASHRRGASISTLGLAGSANSQTSPFNAFAKQRRASISTSSAASSPEFRNSFTDEHAVIEEDEKTFGTPPSPSFARRVSFGAQALRDVRQSGAGAPNGGRRPSSSLYTLSEDHDRTAQNSNRSVETVKASGKSRGRSLDMSIFFAVSLQSLHAHPASLFRDPH
jgi:hypothetical protein